MHKITLRGYCVTFEIFQMFIPAMELLMRETPLESDSHFVNCPPPPAVRVVFLHCRLGTNSKWQSDLKPAKGEKDGTVNVRIRTGQALLLSDKRRAEIVAC